MGWRSAGVNPAARPSGAPSQTGSYAPEPPIGLRGLPVCSPPMTTGQTYRAERLQGTWDAIVIGSGIGGLATAALLARAGKRVLVLERHYVAGGFTHTFRRPGYEWDVGVHYIGEVHHARSVLRQVFDDVSENRLQWARMEDVYDRVIVDGRPFDFVAGRERFIETLGDAFPRERDAIRQYVEVVRTAARASNGFFTERALPPLLGALARPFMTRDFRKWSDRTTHDVLQSLGASPELQGVLAAQYGDYGLPPKQSSFAIHATVAKHYLDGGNYPVGGASAIANTIAPTIEQAGGRIVVAADVERVIVESGRAVGVRLKDGAEARARVVVSSAGVMTTFAALLRPEDAPWAVPRRREVQPSVSHVCLYLGMKATGAELGLRQTNLWIYPGYDHDAIVARYLADRSAPLPVTYVSFPSTKDPDWERRFPGRSTIEAVGLAPFEWFAPWKDGRWRRRGPEYDALKSEMTERLLANVHAQVPSLRGRIDVQELSTPLSTRHFCNYETGEIYGIDHTPERFRLTWLRPHTPLKGFFLTGQDIVTDGVGGALMAGVLTASAILKRNVLGDILKRGPA